MSKVKPSQSAFTLVELLITTAISAVMMIAVTSLFVSFLVTANKSKITQELRVSGSDAMIEMLDQIKSSSEITSSCAHGVEVDSISFIGENGLTTTFAEIDDKIASSSAENGTYDLTNSSEGLDRLQNFSFTCLNNESGAKYVSVNFTLKTGPGETNSPSTSILDFNSGVALRN